MSNKAAAKELEVIMTIKPEEEAAFEARMAAIETKPDDPADMVEIPPRERLEQLFTKEFIATLDDEEVATQIAIMDEAVEEVLKVDEQEKVENMSENSESVVNAVNVVIAPETVPEQLPESLSTDGSIAVQTVVEPVVAPVKRGRGRPKGSKNKPKIAPEFTANNMSSNPIPIGV